MRSWLWRFANDFDRVGRFDSVTDRAQRLLCDQIWNIGVVHQSAADIACRGIVSTPRWLPFLPSGAMLADPACRPLPNGRLRLYAEYLDFRRDVGELWSAEVDSGADLASARFEPLFVPEHHVSYPVPIDDGSGRLLLTAETWQAGAALLWEEVDGALRRVGTLLSGRSIVDPTLWRTNDDRWWLFCTLRDQDPDRVLYLFHARELTGPWTAHQANPIKSSRSGARPAGPLFRSGSAVIRPGQDNSRTYGGAIILHEITRLDPMTFEERVVRRLEPIVGPYSRGLHTLCPAGNYTLIDGKTWRVAPARVWRKLLRRYARNLSQRTTVSRFS